MAGPARKRLSRTTAIAIVAVSAAFLVACSTSQPKGMVHRKTVKSKEYFSEAEYGVKASPRVTNKRSRLPRGGGRDQLGKPYKVKGKWYYPKEERDYRKTGAASWYGDAFHGRLTANGEIYDMTHLTAAHPTMPLPSYARVTNMKNGASVIVRVNDRGPYARGRIIDLSKRAAQLLDYTHTGIAKVQVDYVGRAPLDGNDDQYLMASYRPNGVRADPLSDGLPEGVMIAMNGRTPSAPAGGVVVASAFPNVFKTRRIVGEPIAVESAPIASEPVQVMPVTYQSDVAYGDPVLPEFGPIVPERPAQDIFYPQTQTAFAVMSYADDRVKQAVDPFAGMGHAGMSADDIVSAWKRQNGGASPADSYVAAGSFAKSGEAEQVAKALSAFGRTSIEIAEDQGVKWYMVSLRSDSRASLDAMLEAAWANGAPDALVVRD
ncbi:MAG TPA: septal ring lytic transglycosylase RlpA family protein [Rhizobiaceae bacterium]|nr:septal ring lytic transglycosylase RlpA family protein [Rhizobiaceae bacterium]